MRNERSLHGIRVCHCDAILQVRVLNLILFCGVNGPMVIVLDFGVESLRFDLKLCHGDCTPAQGTGHRYFSVYFISRIE